MVLSGLSFYVILVAVAALNQTFEHDDFSESLSIKLEALPLIFPLHMFTGGMALFLVPLALILRRLHPWHRIAGVIAAIDVLVAGLTAYPVAWIAPVTTWSAAGFTAQASVWLALLAAGIWHMTQGHRRQHRACMIMMLAVMSGAVFFRLTLALWAISAQGQHFKLFYSGNAWLAWLLPLLASTTLLKHAALMKQTGPLKQTGAARNIPR